MPEFSLARTFRNRGLLLQTGSQFSNSADSKSGVTDLYSLDEFSVRKTENIEKGYLMGRYGAIPFLQAGEVL